MKVKKHQLILITGFIIFAIGMLIITVKLPALYRTPDDEAVWRGTFTSSVQEKQTTLEAGEYEVWYEEDYFFDLIIIEDCNGNLLFIDTPYEGAWEKITIHGVEYIKAGSFKATDSLNNYIIRVEVAGKVFITPPMKYFDSYFGIWLGVFGLMAGFMVLVTGVKRYHNNIKRDLQSRIDRANKGRKHYFPRDQNDNPLGERPYRTCKP